MYVIVFYYRHHSFLLELFFDDKEHAQKIMTAFTEAIQHDSAVLTVDSKFGIAALNVDDNCSAVMSALEETEDLAVTLAMRRAKIEQLVWQNPIAFFAQSGRLTPEMLSKPASANLRETFDGNSVLRGQDPDKM